MRCQKENMAYFPFPQSACNMPNSATPMDAARISAQDTRVAAWGNHFVNGNQVLGDLVTECCSDSARGGQGYTDDDTAADLNALVPGTPGLTAAGATGSSNAGASTTPVAPTSLYGLTPVDIITGTKGWPMTRASGPWPRPKLPGSFRRAIANAYPNYGPMFEASRLVPPCPCFSNAPPVVLPVPTVAAPTEPQPAPAPAAPCPYPGCSTGNVCLDLVTGCVLNSQIDPAQQTACALANYGVFGNKGWWVGRIMQSCPTPPFLGTPLPNPPQADPSMNATMNGVFPGQGLSGLGQDDGTSQLGGFLAVVAMFGIVVWAMKK